eukprot:1144935-Pelagomonas_calceolata.AAC.6
MEWRRGFTTKGGGSCDGMEERVYQKKRAVMRWNGKCVLPKGKTRVAGVHPFCCTAAFLLVADPTAEVCINYACAKKGGRACPPSGCATTCLPDS